MFAVGLLKWAARSDSHAEPHPTPAHTAVNHSGQQPLLARVAQGKPHSGH